MNTAKVRNDKLIIVVNQLKQLLVNNESGELYITWKGTSVVVKHTHYLPVNETLTTNDQQ